MSTTVESAPSTPRGRHSKRPQVPPPAAPKPSPSAMTKDVSPLKQLQKMRESGVYKLLPNTNGGDLSDVSDNSSDKENSRSTRGVDNGANSQNHRSAFGDRERSNSNPNILETGQPFVYLSPTYRPKTETKAAVDDARDPKMITEILLGAKMGLDMSLTPTLKPTKPAMDPNRLKIIKEKSRTIDFSNLPKPVINVQLIRTERRKSHGAMKYNHAAKSPRNQSFHCGTLSKSVDDLDKDLPDVSSDQGRDFIAKGKDVSSKSKGDVQTLLKSNFKDDEKIYSLPQPASYGDETLKAVKVITEKYDTLERRKMRALSFRENSKCKNSQDMPFPASPTSPTSPTCPNKPRVKPPAPPPPPPRPVIAPVPPSVVITPADTSSTTVVLPLPASDADDDRADWKSTSGESQASVEDVICNSTGLTEKDLERVDLFYKSHGTRVVVCHCLADVFEGSPGNGSDVSSWEHLHTGVPTFVLNTGQGKRKRELQLVIAERETGFPLWQDRINYLSKYSEENSTTHTCRPSSNLRKVMSIRFFCSSGARDFIGRFHELTSNPDDELWSIGVSKGEKKKLRFLRSKPKTKKLPSKKDISQPCNFSHVTNVDPKDFGQYAGMCDAMESTDCDYDQFRPRLKTS